MHRSFALHPLSLVLGVVFAGICFVSMSQVWPAGQHVLVSYGPNPRDYVQVREGTPYTVPAGKILTITAMGNTGSGTFLGVGSAKINGVIEATSLPLQYGACGCEGAMGNSVVAVASGLTAHPGDVVEAYTYGGGLGRVWGFLSDQ